MGSLAAVRADAKVRRGACAGFWRLLGAVKRWGAWREGRFSAVGPKGVAPWVVQACFGGGSGWVRRAFRPTPVEPPPCNPVESEVGLGEVEAPAPGGLDQPGDRSDEAPDEGPQSVPAGGLGRRVELHGAQEHPSQLAAGATDPVGQELAAGRAVQVQVPQRPLEGVLLALPASVAAHQLRKRRVVPGDEDGRVDGKEVPLGALKELADHDAGVLDPSIRPVAHQHGLPAKADVLPGGLRRALKLRRRRGPAVGVRDAGRAVPLLPAAKRREAPTAVGVVRPNPNGRPLGRRRSHVRLHLLPPAVRRVDPARMRPPGCGRPDAHSPPTNAPRGAKARSAPQLRPDPSNNSPPTSTSAPSTNTATQPLAAAPCPMTAGATRRASRRAASSKPSRSASEPFAKNSPIRRPDGAWESPSSRHAPGSARSLSGSDSAPPPAASDATSAQGDSPSDAPRRPALTGAPSAKSPKGPSRSAVRANAEQPPKPVRRASVNSRPTFSGRGAALAVGAPAGWFLRNRRFAGKTPARCAFQNTSTNS